MPELTRRDKAKPLFLQKVRKPIIKTKIDNVQDILKFWTDCNLKKIPGPLTKQYEQTILILNQVLQGRFFAGKGMGKEFSYRRFTRDEVFLSIERFSSATNDEDYYPINKTHHKNTTILQFFYNPYNPVYKSLFLHYLANSPQLRTIDNNPTLTSYLIAIYKTEITGKTVESIGSGNTFKFIKASSLLKAYFNRNMGKIRPGIFITELKMARWLYESILADVKESYKIVPGYFCSDYTFEVRLPLYLNSQGILR